MFNKKNKRRLKKLLNKNKKRQNNPKQEKIDPDYLIFNNNNIIKPIFY